MLFIYTQIKWSAVPVFNRLHCYDSILVTMMHLFYSFRYILLPLEGFANRFFSYQQNITTCFQELGFDVFKSCEIQLWRVGYISSIDLLRLNVCDQGHNVFDLEGDSQFYYRSPIPCIGR
uniref:Uncharacterized protein n=1 Tax=Cacopsylla melanoneura TaxID=428564 RepID=A0A8D8W4C0_9HEMI